MTTEELKQTWKAIGRLFTFLLPFGFLLILLIYYPPSLQKTSVIAFFKAHDQIFFGILGISTALAFQAHREILSSNDWKRIYIKLDDNALRWRLIGAVGPLTSALISFSYCYGITQLGIREYLHYLPVVAATNFILHRISTWSFRKAFQPYVRRDLGVIVAISASWTLIFSPHVIYWEREPDGLRWGGFFGITWDVVLPTKDWTALHDRAGQRIIQFLGLNSEDQSASDNPRFHLLAYAG